MEIIAVQDDDVGLFPFFERDPMRSYTPRDLAGLTVAMAMTSGMEAPN